MKKRILVVDDHPLISQGLIHVFGEDYSFECAPDRNRAESALSGDGFDVCILDVSLGREDGLSLLPRIAPDVLVFVLSMHANSHYARRARDAGAKGYFTKDGDLLMLKEAVENPERRSFWCSEVLNEAVEGDLERESCTYDALTAREQEVFRLLAEGRNYKEIAYLLSISAKTVNVHRGNIYGKMGFSNQAELVKEGLRLGVVEV